MYTNMPGQRAEVTHSLAQTEAQNCSHDSCGQQGRAPGTFAPAVEMTLVEENLVALKTQTGEKQFQLILGMCPQFMLQNNTTLLGTRPVPHRSSGHWPCVWPSPRWGPPELV